MVRNVVAYALCFLVSGCAASPRASVVKAPTGIRLPNPMAKQMRGSTSDVARGGEWRRVHIGATTYFKRGRSVLALRYGTSPIYSSGFPYFEVIRDAPAWPHDTGETVAPASGLAVVHSETPDPTTRLDFTFQDGNVIRLLSDVRRPTIVNVFESNCSGCTQEFASLKHAAETLVKAGGRGFVVTTTGTSTFRMLKNTAGRNLTVVGDLQRSIYGVMDSHFIPLNYFVRSDGVLDVIEVGALSDDDYARDVEEASRKG